jgi:hypothetical protein
MGQVFMEAGTKLNFQVMDRKWEGSLHEEDGEAMLPACPKK